jgi:hypothetical protein
VEGTDVRSDKDAFILNLAWSLLAAHLHRHRFDQLRLLCQ